MKIAVSGNEARDKIVEGVDSLCDVLKETLGPFGKNCILEKGNYATNDGYTISSELAPVIRNEFARRGALIIHEASSKSNDQAGDGTTTAAVLSQAILHEAVKLLPNDKKLVAKHKPSEILEMIETSRLKVIEKLKQSVKSVESEQELIASAKVAVENEELAQLIGSTQWQIGKDGYILAEETNEPKSSIEVIKGIRTDNGFSTQVVVNNQANQSLELSDVPILLTNYTIGKEDIIKLKDQIISPLIAQKKNSLVIIAKAFTPDAIQLIMQTMQAGFALWPLNAPYVWQGDIMKDLAAITRAKYYDVEDSVLADMDIKDIGFASKLMARRFDTIVTGQDTDLVKYAVSRRVEQLEEKLNGNAVSDFEKKALQARISQFNGGFAILRVGADTVAERKFKLDKATDAVNSVRLALQGGTVKGAGLAFKQIADSLDEDILKRPLACIYNQIISSAPEGYVIEPWVRDPLATLITALTNACSVAKQLINVNCVITSANPPKFNLTNLQSENEDEPS